MCLTDPNPPSLSIDPERENAHAAGPTDSRGNTALSSRSHVDHDRSPVAYVHVAAGTVVREARGDDVDFGMLVAQFRF